MKTNKGAVFQADESYVIIIITYITCVNANRLLSIVAMQHICTIGNRLKNNPVHTITILNIAQHDHNIWRMNAKQRQLRNNP